MWMNLHSLKPMLLTTAYEQNDPHMPISNNSKSKVTTGRPTHFNK